MSTLKDGHAELKMILSEMREENKALPGVIEKAMRRSIRRCRANPPKSEGPEKPAAPEKESDPFDLSKIWNKALVTLVLVITTVITLWANQYLGGSKDASPQAPQAQTQEK